MKRLADPRKTSDAEARKLIADLPAVIWLAYGVHGNEISSPDAALETAYHLLASRNDKIVEEILSKVVVLIDPIQNPDGRDRFVHNFEVAEGLRPDPSQLAAEHNEPWPGGRTNHYYFDMNRDWFAMTQPETRGRLQAVLRWYPLIFTDLHEMGSDATYYFTPEADPFNPFITKTQRDSLEWFGRNNAKWFDQFGFNWFTKENYDEFYPGYGASWPLYHGSIAMTYEQASTRGLVVRRSDGELVNYRDTVRHHFVASISTAETAARNREKLLANFYEYRKSALDDGAKGTIKEYILPRTGDLATVDRLAGNLAFQGIEVRRATAAFSSGGKQYPEGSYAIALAQPAERLIRTLLDPQVSMEDWFLKAEERRRAARQPSEMYDVTAWSLPLQYNVTAVASNETLKGSFENIPPLYRPAGQVIGTNPEVAYLVPWGIASSAKFLAAALQENVHVLTTDRPFKQENRTFPSGTLIIKVKDNAPNIGEVMARLTQSTGAEAFATNSGWVDQGPNFGSHYVNAIPKARIAIAWDQPTSAGSAGATRFLLERQYGYPVTVVRTQQLATGDLRDFNVIVLPDAGFGAGYEAVLGNNGAHHLRDWVQSGGTLVALGPGAVAFLADQRVGMLAISQENLVHETAERPATANARGTNAPAGPATGATGGSNAPAQQPNARVPGKLITSEQEFTKAIQPDTELPDSLHGVLLKAKVDPENWTTAGIPENVYVLMSGRAIYTPIKLDKGTNAVYFMGADQVLASGYMWEENRKQIAYKPFEVVQKDGRGNIVAFTADPNFRGYMDGLHLLFLNAVFRGPAHSQGGRGI
ncbi:MAG: hypothetical protein JO022_10195 [Acidobacteriaceae bacterium]|nr:hypothetical protein [Acidobacteriaceae bacterium]